jgi:hypothetical protein
VGKLEIDFWDVGQGDCTTITLPNGDLIIIDTGPRGSPVVDWLNDNPRDIHAIVLTHNDSDHVGALPAIIGPFRNRIRNFFMLVDRPIGDPIFDKTFRCAQEGERQNHYQITRLERGAVVWNDPQMNAELIPVFPNMSGNIAGINLSPNETSAILCLRIHGKTEIIWAGDSTLARLAQECPASNPTMLFGPHHGAPRDANRKSAAASIATVGPKRAFLSVASINKYSHPRPRYILRLELAGCTVRCSQMTHHCDRTTVADGVPVLATHLALGLRPPRKGVSCRGVTRLTWNGGIFDSDGYDAEHERRIRELRRALCIRGRTWHGLLAAERPRRYR